MLDLITPVIIAQDEQRNIGRTLRQLTWANDVIVVDGGSHDNTVSIVESFPNARVVPRPFTTLAEQWSYALNQSKSEWMMRLDADYFVPAALVDEISRLAPDNDVSGYETSFIYSVFGRPLRASLYPSKTVLMRRDRWTCYQDGHTEAWKFTGKILPLRTPIHHDDRKPLSHWFRSQSRYFEHERDKLLASDPARLDWADRVRMRRYYAPFLMFFHIWLGKGVFLDGKAGLFYCFQRTLAELLLSLYLLERDVERNED